MLMKNYNEFIVEKMGVPPVANWIREAGEMLTSAVKTLSYLNKQPKNTKTTLKKTIDDKYDFVGYEAIKRRVGEYNGEPLVVYTNEVDIVGNFLPDAKFPLYKPLFIFTIYLVPDHAEGKRSSYYDEVGARGPASFNTTAELKEVDGKEVFTGLSFNFTVNVPISALEDISQMDYVLEEYEPSFMHEITHAYQMYNMLKAGKPNDWGKEQIINAMVSSSQGSEFGDWRAFLNKVYLNLSFELNARVSQIYQEMRNRGVTKDNFLMEIKHSTVWDDFLSLKNFNAEKFYKEFDVTEKYAKLGKEQGMDEAKIKNVVLKDVIGNWDNMIQEVITTFEFDIKMKNIPKSALEDPMVFLKYWEKNFHRSAEYMRRKILKLVSLFE